jgi:hypothetical protein
MYIISNRDMQQAIEYIELMQQSLTGQGLRIQTKKWMANNLLKKLRAKQQFPMSSLPDDVKKLIR